ncbi:MAG: ATP-binding cassette domain-containing protein [Acidobacteriota bacterium]|nr:ATP-binding cassette domain-containing protein [Acidobacteriota bacterium]MDE2963227.1 ATP-binding cassette domain-containing protein [Acidobacteriota bacterium]
MPPMVAPNAIVSVQEVSKNFRSVVAVDGASFEIGSGEIFGLLGPNGAGKTTLIRLILDLIRPDAGSIRIQGQPISETHKNRIGYLPEERGLYFRQKVMAVLEYLGTLKGVSVERVRGNARDWLKRLEIDDLRNRPVQELSKGNQQKVQFIATVVSDPDILILDEPFTGLDPINVHLLVRSIQELAAEGKTVVLSVHQMSLVESLCRRVFMINRGRQVLYGDLEDIQNRYSEPSFLVRSGADYQSCDLIDRFTSHNAAATVYLKQGVEAARFLRWLVESGAEVESFQRARTPLDEIFIRVVRDSS